ncbi:MAG: hypothetical protein SFV52_11895 [Saprospiraceae bacterium]|nr:hypothetical protein [Saprospiraceae bacterium]
MFQQPIQYGPGTGTFIDHTLEIFFMLAGAFLIGIWLGWLLWSRYRKGFEKSRVENESNAATAITLRTQVEELNTRLSGAETQNAGLKAEVSNLTWENTELRQKLDAAQKALEQAQTKVRQLETELALDTPHIHADPNAEAVPVTSDIAWEAPATLIPGADTPEHQDPATPPFPSFEMALDEALDSGAVALDLPLFNSMDTDDNTVNDFDFLLDDYHKEDLPAAESRHFDGSDATPIPPPPGITMPTPEAEPEAENEHLNAPRSRGLETASRGTGIPALDLPDTLEPEDVNTADTKTSKGAFVPERFESPILPEPEPILLPLSGNEQPEDLKIVEGIGPKIEALLNKNGIRTYHELAAAPVERLRAILNEAGPQYGMHDPGTWSAQALLAANGEWENLKAYQEFLDAGKRPR